VPTQDVFPSTFDVGLHTLIEMRNLNLGQRHRSRIASHAREMLVEALRFDGRKDPRWSDDEQDVAEFVCGGGSEYSRLQQGAWLSWRRKNPKGTWQEFCPWFDAVVDDTIVNPHLPSWFLVMYPREGSRDKTTGAGYYGVFLAYNIKTVEETSQKWTASAYGILCAPTIPEEWCDNFGTILQHFMVNQVTLNDGRAFSLDSWEFTSDREWLTYDPTKSSNVAHAFARASEGTPKPVITTYTEDGAVKYLRLDRRIASTPISEDRRGDA
jgi:hypothetical protein